LIADPERVYVYLSHLPAALLPPAKLPRRSFGALPEAEVLYGGQEGRRGTHGEHRE